MLFWLTCVRGEGMLTFPLSFTPVWTLVPKEERELSGDLVPVLDTLALGYGKVLGKGR